MPAMPGRDIKVKASDGGLFGGYLALPSRLPAPGIVLLQEIFGVNAGMRAIADEFAGAGYIVVVPDLFWRQRPGVQLDPGSATDRDSAMQLLKGLDESSAIEDAAASMRYVRGLTESNGKVAALGFCLGGKLAFLMAARTDVDGSVSYYGIGIDKLVHEAA